MPKPNQNPRPAKRADGPKAEQVKELRRRLQESYDRARLERQRKVAGRLSPLSLLGLRIG